MPNAATEILEQLVDFAAEALEGPPRLWTLAKEGFGEKVAGAKAAELKAKCIDTLKQVAAILEAKAPADAEAVKKWYYHIGEKVAEADAEGGFLGFGGTKVTDAEKAALAEISSALKLTA